MTIEPVAWQWRYRVKRNNGAWKKWVEWREGRLSDVGNCGPQYELEERPLYTAEALAAAWEQGRAASAEVADSGLGQSMSSYGQGQQAAAHTIRALPNPHKEGE